MDSNEMINTSTAKQVFPHADSEESLIVGEDNSDIFHTPVASGATTPLMDDGLPSLSRSIDRKELALQRIPSPVTTVKKNIINVHCINFFGPKTFSVMASIGSIACVVFANVLKLASHTHLGLSIAALVLATLAFSLMINELVAVTSGRHFVKS